ncbi:hypothetical protein SUGI_0014340 [Cryptomeria japonica]|uniref:germin-like protein 1-1 n=1 Tax=Cryptomeria japonica TaxID=3369 RepID=UPI002408BDBB|nr:germin-like protein 1-1 [Cryptomeria japonica]GLJ05234.1 hypothetical protein SUGI_0014340 [Cryptomeria japonica]
MAFIWVALFLVLSVAKVSSDPSPLQDFCVADLSTSAKVHVNGLPCINPSKVSAKHFTTSVLSTPGDTSGNPYGASVKTTTANYLPGINTLGVIMTRVDLAVGGGIPPHYHPRASEIIYLLEGTLMAAIIDTGNKLYSTEIKTGDVFVFPKAIMHYVQNIGNTTATVIAAFNSQSPGNAVIPFALFTSTPTIPNQVLAKTLQISDTEVVKIKKNFGTS